VTDVIKGSIWFTIVNCFFTLGSVKFLQLSFFVVFVGEKWTVVGFVRGEYDKIFEKQWFMQFILFSLTCSVL